MAVSANFLSYVIDQLRGLGALRTRRMFGGIGLYCDELFFGLIDDDVVYFKVDDSNRTDYTSRGSKAFRPIADDPNAVSMSYFNVPEDILEDSDEARRWARKSVVIAAASAAAKAAKKKKKTPARVSRAATKAPANAIKKAASTAKRGNPDTRSTARKPRTSAQSRRIKR
jgi:DNA transformation protein and related proteins